MNFNKKTHFFSVLCFILFCAGQNKAQKLPSFDYGSIKKYEVKIDSTEKIRIIRQIEKNLKLGIGDENLFADLYLIHLNRDTLLDAIFIGAYGLQWSSIIINNGNGEFQETANLEMYIIEDLVFDDGELSEIYAFRPEYLYDLNDYAHYKYKNNSVKLLTAYCFVDSWDKNINLPQSIDFQTIRLSAIKEKPNEEDLSFRYFFDELDIKLKPKPNSNELFYLKKNTKGKIIGQIKVKDAWYYLILVKADSVSQDNLFSHFFSHLEPKQKYYIGWINAQNITVLSDKF